MSDPNRQFIQGVTDAFAACDAGTATPEQQQIRDSYLGALASLVHDPAVVECIDTAVGSFASVYDAPWDDLHALQRWVRNRAAEADRSPPALASMWDIYDALITHDRHAGAGLKLSAGVNVVAVDRDYRRWLLPIVANAAIKEAYEASTLRDAKRLIRSKGGATFTWSVERSALVPDPDVIRDRLPLPDGGRYIILYKGDPEIVSKRKFQEAFVAIASTAPVADLLIWDSAGNHGSTLWSVRGGLGHRDGVDLPDWPVDLNESQRLLAQYL